MAKKATGITKLPNGNYACRIYKKINNVQYDTTYRRDADTGEPFRTAAEAKNYREKIIGMLRNNEDIRRKEKSTKFKEVWECFLKYETNKRAHATVVKHTSVWNNHVKKEFGEKYISGARAVTIAEIENYLEKAYHSTASYKHSYVLSFAKLFYLLYAVAYKHKLIDRSTYNAYIVDKSTRIKMPKENEDDRKRATEISIYTKEEVEGMYKVFKGTDLEAAFLIAYMCGLRESEIFGLTWDNVDFEKNTITIEKQLLRQDGAWCFDRPKTKNAYRTIEMPSLLASYLKERKVKIDAAKETLSFKSKANEIITDKRITPNKQIVGADLVHRKLLDGLDGKMLSINSLKFYSKRIKALYGYTLEMHKLRRTHLTFLAAHGYPPKALMARAGHSKLDTAMKFYVSDKDETIQKKKLEILERVPLSADDPMIEVAATNPLTKQPMVIKIRQSDLTQSHMVTF